MTLARFLQLLLAVLMGVLLSQIFLPKKPVIEERAEAAPMALPMRRWEVPFYEEVWYAPVGYPWGYTGRWGPSDKWASSVTSQKASATKE